MRILHCCISAFYLDNYYYQENILPQHNKKDGHTVEIIASTYRFKDNDNKKVYYDEPSSYINKDDIPVIRCAYKRIINRFISNKIRAVSGLYKLIEDFRPDVIMFHGTSSREILTVARYKKNNPGVRLYMDSHADYYTSGTNFLSLKVLHGIIYKRWIKKALPYIDKVLNVSVTVMDFSEKVYKIPKKNLELYPLGGIIPEAAEYAEANNSVREELGIPDDKMILLQAGKFDKQKKLVETLKVFSKIKSDKFVFLVVGSLSQDIKEDTELLVNSDARVKYLGWKSGQELNRYMKACDIFIQPGKVSANMQNACCNSCAVIINNLKDYQPFVNGNGWLINDVEEIEDILNSVADGKYNLSELKQKSHKIAEENFDYKKLAKRLYE